MSDREWAEGDSREAMIAGVVTDRKKRKIIDKNDIEKERGMGGPVGDNVGGVAPRRNRASEGIRIGGGSKNGARLTV
jgi:hypothetical protein